MFIRELSTKMSVWAGVLLMFGAYMVTAEGVLPLDMADNSIDDMYNGCEDKMLKLVKKEFLESEKSTHKNFRDSWNEAEKYYKEKEIALEREELVAIYVYTKNPTNVYYELNKAVQNQGKEQKFNYHSLHYFLTRAIQKLAKNTGGKCQTVYRRTKNSFNVLNKNMRFGRFTSSSKYSLKSDESKSLEASYGRKSCFVIETCHGADIAPYSWVKISSGKDIEAEILIPPYEVFEVTNIETEAEDKELPCEVVYTLKSTKKPFSKYNCALFQSFPSHR